MWDLKYKQVPWPSYRGHQERDGGWEELWRGKRGQVFTKTQRCKVSKRGCVHKKLLSLYIKVSPPTDGIISISNISVIFA